MRMVLNPEFHWLRQIATTLHEFHWQFWIIFLDAIAKAKKLIQESIAQNLKQVSLALAMAFNLLLSNPTKPNLTAIAKAKKPLCQWNWQRYFFQLATKICKLEPRQKLQNFFVSGLGVAGWWLGIHWTLHIGKAYIGALERVLDRKLQSLWNT